MIDQDIEAKELKAIGAFCRAEHISCVTYNVLATDDCLDDAVFYLFEKEHIVMTHQLKALFESIYAPLWALAIVRCISIVLEVCIVLVQTVIGQMHIFLLTKVSILAQVVLLSCETRETIFVNVQSEWIDRGKRDVHSQVKFVAIYK